MSIHVSKDPPYLASVARLESDVRKVVLSLLNHYIIKRLQLIKELGFTSVVFKSATHTLSSII
jgi:HD superfamily phosphohydrolase